VRHERRHVRSIVADDQHAAIIDRAQPVMRSLLNTHERAGRSPRPSPPSGRGRKIRPIPFVVFLGIAGKIQTGLLLPGLTLLLGGCSLWESGSRQPQPPAKPIALRASITADQVLEKAPDLARWVETQRDPI